MMNIKILKILLFSVIFIFAAVIISAGMPGESPVEKALRPVLFKTLSSILKTPIDAETIDLQFPGILIITALSAESPGNQDRLAYASKIRLAADFKGMFFGSLMVDTLNIYSLKQASEPHKSGRSGGFEMPPVFPFAAVFSVRNFNITDVSRNAVLNVSNVLIQLNGRGRHIKAGASFSSAGLQVDSLHVHAMQWKIAGSLKKDKLAVSRLSGKIESAVINGSASYSEGKSIQGSLGADGTLYPFLKPWFSENKLNIIAPQKLYLNARAENRRIRIEAKTGILGGDAELYAEAPFDDILNGKSRLIIRDIELTRLQKLFETGETIDSGLLNASADIEGFALSGLKSVMNIRAETKNARSGKRFIPNLQLSGTLKPDSLNCILVQGQNQIKAAVALYEQSRIQGEFVIQLAELADPGLLAGINDLKGRFDGKGKIHGTIQKPEAELKMAGFFSLAEIPFHVENAGFAWRNDQLIINELSFFSDMDFSDEIPEILQNLQPAGHFQMNGQIAGRVKDMKGKIHLDWDKPGFYGFYPDTLSALLLISGNSLNLHNFRLVADSEGLGGSGGFDMASGLFNLTMASLPDKEGRLLLQAEKNNAGEYTARLDLREWPVHSISNMMNRDADMQGSLSGVAEIFPGAPLPDFSLQLNWQKPGWQDIHADSIVIRMLNKQDTIKLKQLSLHNNGLRLLFSGEWPDLNETLQSPERALISCRLALMDMPLSFIQPFTDQSLPEGNLNGAVNVYGPSANLLSNGSLTLQAPFWQISPEAVPVRENYWELTFEDSLIHVNAISGLIMDKPFLLSGHASRHDNGNISGAMGLKLNHEHAAQISGYIGKDTIKVEMHIDSLLMRTAAVFAPELSTLDGVMSAHGLIAGKRQNPNVRGEILFDQIVYTPNAYVQPIKNGRISVRFINKEIILDTLYLEVGSGIVEMSGTFHNILENKKSPEIRLNIKGENLFAEQKNHWSGDIDSLQVYLTGEKNSWSCSGSIDLGRISVITPLNTAVFIRMINQAQRPSESPPLFMQNLALDLRIINRGNFWLDNNLTRSRLSAALSVSGKASQPMISGRVTALDGYVLYLDRKFDLVRGTIDFADPNQINPILDVEAKTRIQSWQSADGRGYDVNLGVSGTKDNLSLSLQSEPPLDELDIASLLTTGYTRRQLAGQTEGTGLTGLIRSRIAELSSQRISGYAARQLGDLFKLDNMTIQGNLFQFGISWGPQLLASRKISGRMSIGYTATLGDMSEQQFRLDYRLAPHISIEGQTDRKGNSGLDLKFWWKFR